MLSSVKVGRGLAPAVAPVVVELSEKGRIVEDQLLALQKRYEFVTIDKYVIMPTHLHVIVILSGDAAGASPRPTLDAAGASPRPTLSDVICAFKSLTTRLCNKSDDVQGRKVWQTSFYDEVIRNDTAYLKIWEYIEDNPLKWLDDIYFAL